MTTIFSAAGTCITSDDYVDRDIFYNGNVIQERATVISRIAPTFLRYLYSCFQPSMIDSGHNLELMQFKSI